MKNIFKNWTITDFIWLLVANISILVCNLYWKSSLFSIIMAITGITANIFVAKQMISNYPLGIINTLMYAYMAYQSRLYGDFTLNLFYYLPTNIIGWILWAKVSNENEEHEIKSKKLTLKQGVIISTITIIAIFLYAYILKLMNGNLTLIDSCSTVLSIVAMILMIKQYAEQWWLWILVNVVSIIMWAITLYQGNGDVATLVMWIIYLLNSIYGLVKWYKANKEGR